MKDLENTKFIETQITSFISAYSDIVQISDQEKALYVQYLIGRLDIVLNLLDEKEKLELVKIIIQIETKNFDNAEDLIKMLFIGNANWVIKDPDEEFIKIACANKYYAKVNNEKNSLLFRDEGLRYLNKMLYKIIDYKKEF